MYVWTDYANKNLVNVGRTILSVKQNHKSFFCTYTNDDIFNHPSPKHKQC
jgi:hypothetical protein